MRRFSLMAVVIVFAVALSAQTRLKTEPGFDGPKGALIVAVGENASSGFPPIAHSVQNARILADILEEQGYSVQLLSGHNATRKAISDAARTVAASVGQGSSQIVLFLSGHYYSNPDGQNAYFLAYDTDPKSIEYSAVGLKDLTIDLIPSPATRLIALVDTAPRQPLGLPDRIRNFVFQLPYGSANAYILSSIGPQAPETGVSSVFSDAVVEGLAGQASGPNGSVNFEGLVNYVHKRVDEVEPARLVRVSSAPATYSPVISRNDQYAEVQVFYATDRARAADTSSGPTYSHDRSSADSLEFGECRISIPHDHRLGKLETANIFTFRKDPGKSIELLRSATLEPNSFWLDLDKSIRKTTGKQVLLFVHGYRTSFDRAVRQTAQLAYDLKFPGPAIAYTWPSDDTPVVSYLRYTVDENNVEWTTPHLRDFMQSVVDKFPGATIHVIAHSMGSRAVVNAIQTLKNPKKSAAIKDIVLAAPDMDTGVFKHLAQSVVNNAERATLYANSNDEALKASEKIHGHSRAGESGDWLVVVKGFDTIDASDIDTGFAGHSYFADTRSVVSDIYNVICLGLEPDKRFGLMQVVDSHGPHWAFNP